MTDQSTKDIFKLLPITSNKHECNLNNNIVHASYRQLALRCDASTYILNDDIAIPANL